MGSGGVPDEARPGGEGRSGRVEGSGGVPKEVPASGIQPEKLEPGGVEQEEGDQGVVGRGRREQDDGGGGCREREKEEIGIARTRVGGGVAERGWGASEGGDVLQVISIYLYSVLFYCIAPPFLWAKNANKTPLGLLALI